MRLGQFRAPQARLGLLPATAIAVVLLIPAAAAQAQEAAAEASSCAEGPTLSKRVEFADLHGAENTLGHKDRWARQLSAFDMGARQRTAAPTTLKAFLDFAAGAGLDWTAVEKTNWQALVDKLSDAMNGLKLHVPNIDLVKTSGQEEFDSAYTRRHAIMFPESMTALPTTDARRAYFLLAHEVFHVLSRTDSLLRDDLYALLGFKTVDGFEYPAELEDRRLSNPDAFEYLHTLTVQSGSGSAEVVPVIQSLLPLDEVIQLPSIFDALDIVLVSVDAGTGEALRADNGDLIKYNFGNTNWIPLMLRNSSYIIHPEEILADNFATLMEWRSDGVLPPANPGGFPVNDVDLLTAIEGVLASGCR
ncbi:hypothetical protein LuPra_02776 [Luteitalea pratensis]|uniref:DUF4157 domain-containing protein n=1 Tax=Luteitalea pratensis TaxID=1855912 RepID=A0A143PLU7_LUTPR|nr:hypothetical protein [Luteitalea pratensis]AMY09557.1 hypothetical protein LuPra_02776 [Luteitalea pratensis]